MTALNGTRVLVTGATSGLGLAMAEALSGAGARVAVTGRDRARARAVATRLGPGAVAVERDVRSEDSVHEAVQDT